MELAALAYEWTLVSRWLIFITRDGALELWKSGSIRARLFSGS